MAMAFVTKWQFCYSSNTLSASFISLYIRSNHVTIEKVTNLNTTAHKDIIYNLVIQTLCHTHIWV